MDNSTQLPQGFGGIKGVDNPSSLGSIDQQKKTLAKPHKDQIVNCTRCNSVNTKFCYFNNYSLSQPRFFCKTCRRYWTAGGSLRNVPVGGGSRKNRRSSSSICTASSVLAAAVHAQAQAASALHQGHDLNLSFPPHPTTHDDLHRHHKYPNPSSSTFTTPPNFSIDQSSNTKLLPHHLPTNMAPLLPPMGLFKNSLLVHDSNREMMISLVNPAQRHNPTNSSNPSIFTSAEFPQMNQDQFRPSSLSFSLDRFNTDDEYAGSSLQLGVHQQGNDGSAGGERLDFPLSQQDKNNNKEHQKQVPNSSAAASSDNVQFDYQQNNINRLPTSPLQGGGGADGSSTGFWTGMLSGGSW